MAEEYTNPLRAGLVIRKIAEPCTVVVFGATGDLTARKLMPALFNLMRDGHLNPRFSIVGYARREKSDNEFRDDMRRALHEFSRQKPKSPEEEDDFLSRVHYSAGNFDDLDAYTRLRERLEELEKSRNMPANRLFYLATAPEFFPTVTEYLKKSRLVHPVESNGPWARVIIEKPFGTDLESARALNRHVQQTFDESQVYRIDHYLGKETVQNVLAFRFANSIFEPLWRTPYVDNVQITVAETLGMEGRRGQYYDTAGALRDMVQNHILQLLSLTAMEAPSRLGGEHLRNEKIHLLSAIQPMTPAEVAENVVRGQYGPGSLEGKAVRGFREEELVNPESSTETYVALRFKIQNARWAGVPFLLRHGKRLPKKASEIAVTFRQPPHRIFGGNEGDFRSNTLVLRIQPDEGISLSFDAKQPGVHMRLQDVKMDFRYGTSFGQPAPEAYERLLLDGLTGDPSLFTRADEVDQAWRIITAIHTAWAEQKETGFPNYAAGTWGPKEANKLVATVDGGWRKL